MTLIIVAVVLALVVTLALLAWFNHDDGITTISSPTAAWRHDDVGSRLTIGNERYVVVHVVSPYVVQVKRLA